MKNNETGEFELVMGNRQLLTGFLIVVLLFGVAFAMGYIVGRNSTPAARAAADVASAAGNNGRPQPTAAAQPDQTAPPDQAPPAAAETAPAQPPADTATPPAAQPTTQAATPATNPPAPAAAPPAVSPPTPAADTIAPADAPPGSYWQVIATSNRTSAEALLQTLKDKGFPVTLSPGPNNLVRVLVGPFGDTASKGRAKTRLEEAGFHPVLK